MTQSVDWDLENDAVRRELDITRDELRLKEKQLANAAIGLELYSAENDRLKANLSLAVEALKPFASVEIDKRHSDDAGVAVESDFTREEAEEFNNMVKEKGLPVKTADIQRGMHWPKHCHSLDTLTLGDFRRAREAYEQITKG